MEIKLGRIVLVMMLAAEIFPETHSMMVVTSPIGDQVPPALAAKITMPVNQPIQIGTPRVTYLECFEGGGVVEYDGSAQCKANPQYACQ